ncbi:MAG: ComEC/Rec2 family competence protein, partial [Gammaproteobacteria bacterium]
MLRLAIAFVAGVLLLQQCAELPPWYGYPAVLIVLVSLRVKILQLPSAVILGFFWSALQAELALAPTLNAEHEGRTLLVEGRVLDMPQHLQNNGLRFPFYVERIDAGKGWSEFNARVRLSWYRTTRLPAAGEHWQLAVRLKRPRGFSNPGGFDYERWLFQQRIRATGYIREDVRNRLVSRGSISAIARLRYRLLAASVALNERSPSLSMIRALTIGDRSGITPRQWDVLKATGTSHLMAISGLHISLVAGMVFWCARKIWTCTGRVTERLPAGKAAAIAALLAALLYAFLAGFSIPTRRAVLMVSVLMLAILSDRHASLCQSICLAAIVTLVVDPLSVLAAGWWLSFWAVAVIAYMVTGRQGKQTLAGKWVVMHIVLAVTMLPLLLVFFQQASIIAPLANFIAVPWVGMLVVPVALLGGLLYTLTETGGATLLLVSAYLLDWIWPYLEWLATPEYALWQQHKPVAWTLLPAVAGMAILFMPRGMPGRWSGLLLCAPLLVVKPAAPGVGEIWLTLLDV